MYTPVFGLLFYNPYVPVQFFNYLLYIASSVTTPWYPAMYMNNAKPCTYTVLTSYIIPLHWRNRDFPHVFQVRHSNVGFQCRKLACIGRALPQEWESVQPSSFVSIWDVHSFLAEVLSGKICTFNCNVGFLYIHAAHAAPRSLCHTSFCQWWFLFTYLSQCPLSFLHSRNWYQ